MPTIDYQAVTSFITLLRDATWWTEGDFEYLRLSMNPGLEPYLPEGIVVESWGEDREHEMVEAVLRRSL